MDEQAVLQLARRRRRGRRAGLALAPVLLLAWFVAASWDDGPPDAVSILLLVALGGCVAGGWWWLERSAGHSVAELRRRPRGPGPSGGFTAEELDDARAELALRTCSSPARGGRVRVEGMADLWLREGRFGLVFTLFCLTVPVLLVVTGGPEDGRGVPWPAAVLWALVGLLLLGRSLHRRRLARRWVAAHGAAPEVAGHR